IRRPSTRANPGSSVSTPISSSNFTARGVRPSPQGFSRGKAALSTRATSTPWRARKYAAVDPPGPAPTTRTSTEAAFAPCATLPLSALGRACERFHKLRFDAKPEPIGRANGRATPRAGRGPGSRSARRARGGPPRSLGRAERSPVARERGEHLDRGVREDRTDLQRPLDGVAARFQRRDPARLALVHGPGRSLEIEELSHRHLHPHAIVAAERRGEAVRRKA